MLGFDCDMVRFLLDSIAHLRDIDEYLLYDGPPDRMVIHVRESLEAYVRSPEALLTVNGQLELQRLERVLRQEESESPSWINLSASFAASLDIISHLVAVSDLSTKTELVSDDTVLPPSIGIYFKNTVASLVLRLGPDPREWLALGPRRFEEILAKIWAGLGWETVLTPPSADGGFDIRAIRNERGIIMCYLIEAKAYDPARPVGIDVVRKLFGVVERERATRGILATTSHFTKGTIAENRALKYRLSLANFEKVFDWVIMYREQKRV
ncbi:MAG TPA: restriction endonuclease [bacterium]|nr:restriction endonuclease [bacterium]